MGLSRPGIHLYCGGKTGRSVNGMISVWHIEQRSVGAGASKRARCAASRLFFSIAIIVVAAMLPPEVLALPATVTAVKARPK